MNDIKQYNVKSLGQVFTPSWIVDLMLYKIGYNDETILSRKILEPSFGKGAFLVEMVRRYIDEANKKGWSKEQIKKGLEDNIYGVEINSGLHDICLRSLDKLAVANGIIGVDWNLYNMDFLDYKEEDFDLIIGNPPFMKVHSLQDDLLTRLRREYVFCNRGNIDIYLAFFERSLRLLKGDGKIIFISPNSYMRNASHGAFRDYITGYNLLHTIINFKSHEIYEKIHTYDCITILDKGKRDNKFDYYEYEDNEVRHMNTLPVDNYIGKKFIISTPAKIALLKEIRSRRLLSDFAKVQYGLCTQNDSIFITDRVEDIDDDYVLFNGHKIERKILRPIIKGSRMNDDKNRMAIYPYYKGSRKWMPIQEDIMKEQYPFAYDYLSSFKGDLLQRDKEKAAQWYEYGRSQSIQTSYDEKLIINTVVYKRVDIKRASAETLVYTGTFLTLKSGEITLEEIEEKLKTEEFLEYARMLGKYMQGDYRCITPSIIKGYGI